jgi:hypothetical protein
VAYHGFIEWTGKELPACLPVMWSLSPSERRCGNAGIQIERPGTHHSERAMGEPGSPRTGSASALHRRA